MGEAGEDALESVLGKQVGEMGVVVFVQEGVDETSGVFEGGGVGGGAGGGERGDVFLDGDGGEDVEGVGGDGGDAVVGPTDEGERAEDAEGGLLENAALFGGDGGEKGGFDAKAQTGVVDAVVAKTSQDGAEEGQAFATLSGHRFLDPAFGFERLAQKPLKLRRGCEHTNEHER